MARRIVSRSYPPSQDHTPSPFVPRARQCPEEYVKLFDLYVAEQKQTYRQALRDFGFDGAPEN